jgi:hypothetical protein
MTGRHREDDRWLPQSYKERWQDIEEASHVSVALLLALQSKFLKKEIIATGVPIGFWSYKRVTIPPDNWLRLWPDFAHNRAMGGAGRYDEIQVTWDQMREARHDELTELCTVFLRKRQGDGEDRRKILLQETAEYLASPLPARVFTAAYKEVFNKRRGRPRMTK